jgi:uncharacterized membrane protein
MNAAHLHSILNHFPVIGFILGMGILLAGTLLRQAILRQAGLLILFLMALLCIPVFYSGHEAEEIVEKLATQSTIEEHEKAGEWAYYLTLTTGLLSAAAFAASWKGLSFARYATLLAALIGILSTVALSRTAYLGGLIRHTEFSEPAAIPMEPMVPHRDHQH